tara:strand:- start:243 stop:356 length:114 start_codon:yes stop_codon:yes gene_type:complete
MLRFGNDRSIPPSARLCSLAKFMKELQVIVQQTLEGR